MSQQLMRVVARRFGQNVTAIPKAASANSALIAQRRLLHSSKQGMASAAAATATHPAPVPPEPRENPAVGLGPSREENVGAKRLADFDLEGGVFIVTGGARGLGLCLAEGLVEAGGNGTS